MANGPTKSSVFRLCTIVTFVVAAGLTFCSVFSVWRFTAHDMNDWDVDHGTYWNALNYFDSNRNQQAILDVQTVTQTVSMRGGTSYAAQYPCQQPTGNDAALDAANAHTGAMDHNHGDVGNRGNLAAATDMVSNSAWKAVTNLGTWRGTVAGCENSADVTKIMSGACASNSMTTGTDVGAQGALQLNRWRSQKYFCVLRTVASKYQSQDSQGCLAEHPLDCGDHCFSVPANWPTDSNPTVAAADPTYRPALCPLTSMKFVPNLVANTGCTTPTAANNQCMITAPAASGWTAGWVVSDVEAANVLYSGSTAQVAMRLDIQRLTKAQDTNAESVDLAVEWYGNMCVDPALSPADPSQNYALMASSGAGCGSVLGEDSSTDVMDSLSEWNFLSYNKQVEGDNPLNNAATGEATRVASTTKMADVLNDNVLNGYKVSIQGEQYFRVNLMNRRRILTKSSVFCDGFRYNSNEFGVTAGSDTANGQHIASTLLAQFDTIWDLVKWLAIVSTSTAVLAVMMVLLVVLDGSDRQTQTYMTMMYVVCLVGLFCSVVLMWKARYLVQNNYALPFSHFTKAQEDVCITSTTWNNLLNLWITGTSFGGLETQLLYCLILFVVMLVVAVIFAIWALMKLAKVAVSRKRNL